MSEHSPDRFWSGIDIVKLVAGTLAAISAAVVGSFLGVAGTLAGAAVVSVVTGLGTEVYAKSLERGVSRVKGRPGQSGPGQSPPSPPEAGGSHAAARQSTQDNTPGRPGSAPQAGVAKARRPRWQMVALPAMAFFVLAMGAVFAVEKAAGKSVPSMVGATSSRTTTLGSAAGVGKKAEPTTETSKGPDGEESDKEKPAPGATTPAQDAPTAPAQPGEPAQGEVGEQGTTGGQQDSPDSGGSGGQEGPTGGHNPADKEPGEQATDGQAPHGQAPDEQAPDGQAPAGAPAPE